MPNTADKIRTYYCVAIQLKPNGKQLSLWIEVIYDVILSWSFFLADVIADVSSSQSSLLDYRTLSYQNMPSLSLFLSIPLSSPLFPISVFRLTINKIYVFFFLISNIPIFRQFVIVLCLIYFTSNPSLNSVSYSSLFLGNKNLIKFLMF